MKCTRAVLLSVLLFLLSGFAFADGLPPGDPAIEINDPTCDGCPTVTAGQIFTFFAPSDPAQQDVRTVVATFRVDPKSQFLSMDFEAPIIITNLQTGEPDTSLVACTSNEFFCTVSFIDGVTNMHLGPFDSCGGVEGPSCIFRGGDVFEIALTGWQPGLPFAGQGHDTVTSAPTTPFISAPEPSSLLLFGTGAIFALRRKLKFRKN